MTGTAYVFFRSFTRWRWPLLVAWLLLPACSLIAPATSTEAPAPQASQLGPSGTVDLNLTVTPPSDTPADARVVLVLVDEVSGLPFNTQEIPMGQQPDGRWQVAVNRLRNSVLHYRYAIRGSVNADEVDTRGGAIRFRTLWLPSELRVDDLVPAWSGGVYTGPTGDIVGTVVAADSAEPLAEVYVSTAGVSAFSDGSGDFRLDGLEPGLHTLTAFSTDGSTIPFQQGAVVAGERITPVLLSLQPAAPVQVTFEVEIPSDTASGMPLRMAGNLRTFGDRFADIPGQSGGAIARMPKPVQVDASHYILIAELFSGADFRYKYTLGDGLWNAERDEQGFLITRQLIVPEADAVIQDVVHTWMTPGTGPVTFNTHIPSSGSGDLSPGLQFKPSDGFQPFPMSPDDEGAWSFVLYGPLDVQGPLTYRYCRMADCARVQSGGTGESAAQPRTLTPSPGPAQVNDEVTAWVWPAGPSPLPDFPVARIEPRPDFEAGVELQPDPDPNSSAQMDTTLNEIAAGGANAVTLTPTWRLGRPGQMPMMALDPGDAPFSVEIATEMAVAHSLGLGITLRPILTAPDGDIEQWWQDSSRDTGWWDTWFEAYRSFLLTYAGVAANGGAAKIVISGSELGPAFPRGELPDGSPAGAPADAEKRWRELIDAVRAVFPGKIVLEMEVAASLQPPPAFVDAVDQVQLYWHPALDGGAQRSIEAYAAEAGRWMDQAVLGEPRLADKPLILSVEYPSAEGGTGGCVPQPGDGCYPPAALAMGALPNPAPRIDLESQALAYSAVLMQAYSRPQFRGFYSRGYNPSAALQDLSTSVRGKPAQVVLWYWYSRLTGKVAP